MLIESLKKKKEADVSCHRKRRCKVLASARVQEVTAGLSKGAQMFFTRGIGGIREVKKSDHFCV